jgi:hypothetical protein
MKCEEVSKHLSWFIDDVLEGPESDGVSEHLNQCSNCRREFDRLLLLRRKLSSLPVPEPPDYLRHLLELRLSREAHETWRERVRDAWEYRWSKIRTTEGMWYLTRLAGSTMTVLLFLAISAAINPIYFALPQQPWQERTDVVQNLRDQLLKNVGVVTLDSQKKHTAQMDPGINPLYLLEFAESASRSSRDDTVAVAAVVDKRGEAKIQNILEYPSDKNLLSDFNSMLVSARYRPATQNGRAVESHLVLAFSKMTVYD